MRRFIHGDVTLTCSFCGLKRRTRCRSSRLRRWTLRMLRQRSRVSLQVRLFASSLEIFTQMHDVLRHFTIQTSTGSSPPNLSSRTKTRVSGRQADRPSKSARARNHQRRADAVERCRALEFTCGGWILVSSWLSYVALDAGCARGF